MPTQSCGGNAMCIYIVCEHTTIWWLLVASVTTSQIRLVQKWVSVEPFCWKTKTILPIGHKCEVVQLRRFLPLCKHPGWIRPPLTFWAQMPRTHYTGCYWCYCMILFRSLLNSEPEANVILRLKLDINNIPIIKQRGRGQAEAAARRTWSFQQQRRTRSSWPARSCSWRSGQ